MTDHTLATCTCGEWNCMICAGGLGICTVCGGAEGSLAPECPKRRLTFDELQEVYRLNMERWAAESDAFARTEPPQHTREEPQ